MRREANFEDLGRFFFQLNHKKTVAYAFHALHRHSKTISLLTPHNTTEIHITDTEAEADSALYTMEPPLAVCGRSRIRITGPWTRRLPLCGEAGPPPRTVA